MHCSELLDSEISKIKDAITGKFVLLKTNFQQSMTPLKDLKISKSSSSIVILDRLGYQKDYGRWYDLTYNDNILIIYSHDCIVVDTYYLLVELGKFKDYYTDQLKIRALIDLFNDKSNYENLENYLLFEQFTDGLRSELSKGSIDFTKPVRLKINKTEFSLNINIENLDKYIMNYARELECNFSIKIDNLSINMSAQSINYLFKLLDNSLNEKGVHKW